MAGTIFDGSFQTSLPDTSGPLNLMAAALAARQKALDPTGIFSGLKNAGKVFTDMESELKKSNTALLQRHLDAMSPSQVEQMVANGVDPIKEAYLAGVPINGADAELNKAWDKDITDAGTQIANKWVATVLPTLSHEARMELMSSNDPKIWAKYGLSSFARISPDVQQQIKTSLQDAATAELRYRTAQVDLNNLVTTGQTPIAAITEGLSPEIGDNANWNDPTLVGELNRLYDAGKLIYADQAKEIAKLTNDGKISRNAYGAEGSTVQDTQFERQFKDLSDGLQEWMSNRGNTDVQTVIDNYMKYLKEEAVNDDGSPFFNFTDAQFQEMETRWRRQYSDPNKQQMNEAGVRSYHPVYEERTYISPKDITKEYGRWQELVAKGDDRAPNVKQNLEDSLDYLWMENLLPAMQDYVKNNKIDVKQFRLLADQWRRDTQRPDMRKGNPGLLRMNDDSFERVVKKLESYADNFSALLSDQQKLKIDRSRYELLGTSTIYATMLNSKNKVVPKHIKQLMESENLDLAAHRLLNAEDYTAYQGTDELTKACIVWQALSTYRSELGIDKSNEELLKDITNLGTLNNARFSAQLRLAIDADIPNRYDSRNLEQNTVEEVKKHTQQN